MKRVIDFTKKVNRRHILSLLILIMMFQLGMLTQGLIDYFDPKVQIVEVPIPIIQKKTIVKKVPHKGYYVSKAEINRLLSKPARVTQGIKPDHVKRVIESTLIYLGIPKKDIPKWTELLLITSQVESDMGYLLTQIKGPAQGIFQLEPATERWIYTWLKDHDPELLKKIRSLRCEAHLGIHETQYNMSYAVAMAYMEYHWRGVSPVGKSTFEMLRLHKKHYNTDLGKASVSNSLKKITGSRLMSQI